MPAAGLVGENSTLNACTTDDDENECMPGDVRVRGSVVIPEAELHWRFSRSSGPGGQSVNTTDSRVELSYDVAASTALGPVLKARALQRLADRLNNGVLTVRASEHRSQLRNREEAQRRLVRVLYDAIAPPPRARRPTRPSRAATERRLKVKRQRGETKRLRGIMEN
jgi:ribosome-associated protein